MHTVPLCIFKIISYHQEGTSTGQCPVIGVVLTDTCLLCHYPIVQISHTSNEQISK